MDKNITLNQGTQFLTSNVSWDFNRRGVTGRTNKFTPQRLDPALKLYENNHTSSSVEDSVTHCITKEGRREGRAWAGLS